MQFITGITKSTTYQDLANRFGTDTVDQILTANGLNRRPDVGSQLLGRSEMLKGGMSTGLSSEQYAYWLNTVTSDADVFETLALSDPKDAGVFASTGSFSDALRVPDGITVSNASDILGGAGDKVDSEVYKKVMECLSGGHTVDPAIFSEYSTIAPSPYIEGNEGQGDASIFNMFNLPWGKITLYSALDETSIDFPVYPDEIGDGSKANYVTMPNMIYQYEPWYMYESSGPRSITYNFHFHRDMWTGDHRDGKANQLVRFCQACCYPEYNGSAVHAPLVTLYINGVNHITGIMTSAEPRWSGPIGRDGFYLECNLSISITEVSPVALDYYTMKAKPLIG